MKIGITGANGMLGRALVTVLSKRYKVFATSRSKGIEGEDIEWDCFDLTDAKLLDKWLDKVKPDLVVHCAAIVNVDFCEENPELATLLHVETTRAMSYYLEKNKGRLIYISTDSVFDGRKSNSYSESDSVNPLNVYAKTKLMGEFFVKSMTQGLVLRTNIIGQTRRGETSFFEWVLKELSDNKPLNLFYDVKFSPLDVYSLSFFIEKIVENPLVGLYHCASNDGISKYDFGREVARIFQLSDSNINRTSINDAEFKAHRPKNMTLNVEKISIALKYNLPSSMDVIKLMKYQYDNKKGSS